MNYRFCITRDKSNEYGVYNFLTNDLKAKIIHELFKVANNHGFLVMGFADKTDDGENQIIFEFDPVVIPSELLYDRCFKLINYIVPAILYGNKYLDPDERSEVSDDNLTKEKKEIPK